jgi:DNA uptake protein ComE-like DNA-binding protein
MLIVFFLIISILGYSSSYANEDIAFYKAYRTAQKQPKIYTVNPPPSTLADEVKLPSSSDHIPLINLNTATPDTLRTLPFIQLEQAEAIIRYRAQLPDARFTSLEQLLNIETIDADLLKRVRVYLVL